MSAPLFPALRGQASCYIDMNETAKSFQRASARSPFLNAKLADRFLAALHRKKGVAFSWGGYLEDRRDLWRGSYLAEDASVHLGIDVNVRAGTEVSVTHSARVVRVTHDPDMNGGWGSVVMFELEKPLGDISHFLYAHLSKDSIGLKEGDRLVPGDIAARVGRTDENGGWFEHLHVQAMTREAWDKFGGDLKQFDGYSAKPSGSAHPYFPNPAPLL
jgi:murein DD-endopeptidase MepM/ murein hydrolase activator NlpD